MSEVIESTATPKAKTEYTEVAMEDGRKVKFAGKRQVDKTVVTDEEAGNVTVRFDFRNGRTLSISSEDLPDQTCLAALGHGISQKCGDEYSGVKDVDDMVLAVEDMIARLTRGDWSAPRESSDSFSGASVVIRAICEVTGKSVEEVKAFLQGKIDAAEKRGEKLSRNELYRSFRAASSKTGQVIARLEQEALAKSSKVSAADLLDELNG